MRFLIRECCASGLDIVSQGLLVLEEQKEDAGIAVVVVSFSVENFAAGR